jgi:hypothetical protein
MVDPVCVRILPQIAGPHKTEKWHRPHQQKALASRHRLPHSSHRRRSELRAGGWHGARMPDSGG